MKSVFTRLSALFLIGTVAMVGCTDFSEDLRVLNDKIENLASTTAQEVKRLDDAIASLAAKIAEQYATKQEVELVQNAVDQVKADLKTAKEDVQKALDLKADKSALEAAVNNVTTELGEVAEQLSQLVIKDPALESSIGDLNNQITSINGQLTTIAETLAGKANQSDLDALDQKIEGQLTDLNTQLTNLVNGKLDDLQKELENYKKGIDTELETVKGSITTLETTLTQKIEALENRATKDQLTELKNELIAADNAIKDLLAAKADKTAVEEAIAGVNAAVNSLTAKVNAWVDNDTIYDDTELRTLINSAKNEYQAIETSLVARIEALESSIVALRSELRGAVLVPQTLYNGTKAVIFKRVEGENVLKTFATVSYHFNPSNFDVTKAQYEIVATPVEFRPLTPAEDAPEYGEGPAIEIVGEPVQENGKVTFKLERAKGAGNMFALKVTLESGAVIVSDYALVLDEANYCIATATSSFQVERLAFNFPSLTSISAIIDYVKSLGQTIEDFESTIQAITAAIEAMQNNDITSAISNLITIPGLSKETATIEGVGVYKVQVETLDAEEIIESLQNAQSIAEIRNIITELLGKAEGLGEVGSAITNGLNEIIGGSGLNDLFGQYDNLLDFELPELILTYEKAVAKLDQYQTELDKAKAEFQTIKDEMNTIIAGLDEATQAEVAALQAELDALNAELEDLEARYDAAGLGDKISLGLEIAEVKGNIAVKEAAIIAKAGSDYFNVRAELFLKESGVKTAEVLLQGAREAVDLADQGIKNAEEKIAKLETEILNKVKDYIFENTELGQYLKELENALGQQAWEAKKAIAQGTAELFAIDALIADLIQNYNAANQQVVDEFANSLFGRVAYLIQTKEAEQAFEAIGLADLYVVLKQLPDLLTLIIKYYPAGVDLSNFTNFNDFGTIFSDYLTGLTPVTEVEWEVDYLPAK